MGCLSILRLPVEFKTDYFDLHQFLQSNELNQCSDLHIAFALWKCGGIHLRPFLRPTFAGAMAQLLISGEEHLRAGRLDEALRCFELTIEQTPDSHRAIYLSALTHLKLSQEATALLQFNRALELNPDNPNYLADLAVTKLRLGDGAGALLDLDRCVQLDPQNSYRYSLRAFARNSMGDVQGAITDYQRAVELDPEDAIAYNNLGMAEESLGYVQSANDRFATADRLSGVKQQPKDHTIAFKQKHSPEQSSSEGIQPKTYWDVVRGVITSADERKEFWKFLGNMFKSDVQ